MHHTPRRAHATYCVLLRATCHVPYLLGTTTSHSSLRSDRLLTTTSLHHCAPSLPMRKAVLPLNGWPCTAWAPSVISTPQIAQRRTSRTYATASACGAKAGGTLHGTHGTHGASRDCASGECTSGGLRRVACTCVARMCIPPHVGPGCPAPQVRTARRLAHVPSTHGTAAAWLRHGVHLSTGVVPASRSA